MSVRTWVFMMLLACSATAMAQECPLPAGADQKLAAFDGPTRLQFLRLSLNSDAKKVQRWRWGWISGFGFLTLYNVGSGFATGPAITTHAADFVGAGASVISIVPLLANPPHVVRDGPAFEAKVESQGSSPDVCGLVVEGEKLLAEDAHGEKFAAGWVTQVANVALNALVFVITGAGYHSWSSGAVTGGIGLILGEVMIQTTPTNLDKDEKLYQSGALTPVAPALGFSIQPSGLGFAGTF